MTNDLVIARLDTALTALAEAKTIQETKKILDVAKSAEVYAKRQKLGKEAEQYATSIIIEALRQLGEQLKETPRATGGTAQRTRYQKSTELDPPTLDELGLDKKTAQLARDVAELNPDEIEKVKSGAVSIRRKVAEHRKNEQRTEKTRAGERAPKSGERFRLIHSQIETLDLEPDSIDFIITDPPYPEEYLPLYETLAERAAVWLKPGGSLIVMIGQSYLPAIVAMLSRHLNYNWTEAYLTPGKTYQAFDRKSLCGFKPLFWYTKGDYTGKWVYDVFKSDAPDKDSHEWGQSESGISNIIQQFTNEGDLILDPFCGGGTTVYCAVKLGRRAIGADSDADSISITAARMKE